MNHLIQTDFDIENLVDNYSLEDLDNFRVIIKDRMKKKVEELGSFHNDVKGIVKTYQFVMTAIAIKRSFTSVQEKN